MVGMKVTDPHKIVTTMMTEYTLKQLNGSYTNKTAEAIGHMLAGMRVSRHYRRDVPEAERYTMAREFLRGILADHAV